MPPAQNRLPVVRQWRCLEVGCETVVTAASDDELVEAANAHVREAHDSYELEEVILAGAEDSVRVRDANRNAAQSGATGDPRTR